MKCSIAFRNLPFEPDTRQVIYVESQFDERMNALIRDHYDWLKRTFKRAQLDFIYLPMFFNDEEIKEKILYYAPYLTNDIMEKAELRSSFLLKYMCPVENKDNIAPSLLYALTKENGVWLFRGLTIDIDGDDRNAIFRWFERAVSNIKEEISPAVRFSVEKCGGAVLYSKEMDEPFPPMDCSSAPSSAPGYWDRVKRSLRKVSVNLIKEEREEAASCEAITSSSLEEIREEKVEDILEELQTIVNKLRLIGLGPAAIHEAIDKSELISRLYITDDLRIFLPDYNNIEITLTPQYKAIYLLFLFHPEGIVLKRLEEYHQDLVYFYKKTSGKEELPPKMIESVKKMEVYGNNQINVVIARIRKAFESRFDKHLAKNYVITGKAGEAYSIPLDPELIQWEDDD